MFWHLLGQDVSKEKKLIKVFIAYDFTMLYTEDDELAAQIRMVNQLFHWILRPYRLRNLSWFGMIDGPLFFWIFRLSIYSFLWRSPGCFICGLHINFWGLISSRWIINAPGIRISLRMAGWRYPRQLQVVALPGFTVEECSLSSLPVSETYPSTAAFHSLGSFWTVACFCLFQLHNNRITVGWEVFFKSSNLTEDKKRTYWEEYTGFVKEILKEWTKTTILFIRFSK